MSWLQSIWTVAWKSLAFLIAWAAMLAVFIVPFQAKIKQVEKTNPLLGQFYLELASAVTIILAAYCFTTLVDKRTFGSLGFVTRYLVHDIGLGIVIGILWLAVSLGVLLLAGWALPQHPTLISLSVLTLASIGLLINVVTQEILVRSYIFQTIQIQFGVTAAIILSALLFVALHAGAIKDSWLAALNVFGAGLLFGVAYAVSKNLWLPIAIHFAWNCALGPVLGLSLSGQNPFRVGWQLLKLDGPALFTGGVFGLEGSMIVTVTTAVFMISILWLYRQ
jgi:uncharacterized protein